MLEAMGRPLRIALGGYVYHVLNRANARMAVFQKEADYAALTIEAINHPYTSWGSAHCARLLSRLCIPRIRSKRCDNSRQQLRQESFHRLRRPP
jgi:hypothetical protein